MTYEEALEYAKSYITLKGIPIDSKEATKCIVEALEKQIPKKPIAIDVGGQHELICPNCERNHVAWRGIMYSYCNICGQRIDWREVE